MSKQAQKKENKENEEAKDFKVNYPINFQITINSTKKDFILTSKTFKKFAKFLKGYANVT